jgi:hypothetical protein
MKITKSDSSSLEFSFSFSLRRTRVDPQQTLIPCSAAFLKAVKQKRLQKKACLFDIENHFLNGSSKRKTCLFDTKSTFC